MATLLLLTNDMHVSSEILPALELLPHQVRVAQAEATALLDAPSADVILLDARRDLVGARSLCRLMETTGKESPLLVVVSEGGLAALSGIGASTTSCSTPPARPRSTSGSGWRCPRPRAAPASR